MTEQAAKGWYADPENPGKERWWDGQAWSDRRRDSGGSFEVNPMAVFIGGTGILLAIIGVFLPHLDSQTYLRIAKNTLIQSGDGGIVIGAAVLAVLAIYRATRSRTRDFAALLLGLVIVGIAVYDGTGTRADLQSLAPGASRFGIPATEHASPGVGLYMVGAGGTILAIGGLMLAGLGANARAAPQAGTKKCPDCAEAVLADANVCKHCGYRFQGGDAAAPVS